MIVFMAVGTLLVLIGTLFNVRKNIKGQYFFAVANIFILFNALIENTVDYIILYIVFTISGFYGVYYWRKVEKKSCMEESVK